MRSPTLARDIMVTKLVTLTPHMDVYDAIRVLLKHRISGAPVIDRQRNYLGVFSEKSCMRILLEAAYDGLPTNEISAFYDRNAITIDEETDLLQIAQIFQDTPARRLPVLRGPRLVGQISRRDVLQATHQLLKPVSSSDSALLYISALVDRQENPIG